MTEVQQRIDQLVKSNRVVLFMKGTRGAPACGFSATVVEILDQYLPKYETVNVLSDAAIRDGVKEYANWPTIPQLYVDGEFVGGCDIVREMDAKGDLAKALGDLVRPAEPPTITITDAAAAVFAKALADANADEKLRLEIDGSFVHDLALSRAGEGDVTVVANGITIVLDRGSARRAAGVTIDYVSGAEEGFKIDNPNAPPTVKWLMPRDAKEMLASDPAIKFVDVRSEGEREQAKIEGTMLLTRDTMAELMALPKETPLVFYCHHGQRSQQAALHFLEHGFTRVYNLVGGIDSWSREVDPSVPRY
ncbi:MAG TPA: Grx4 family monothiol glutaredoxin [Nannocystaceae bacterium]|nr:Grx4 family monothiol glutaredoxin [Nannocystaceae bacterium]